MDFYFSFGKKKASERHIIFSAAIIWGFIETVMDPLLDFLNRKIIAKFDGEKLKVVFDELDIFWLRNGGNKHYSNSDIRLIISLFVRSVQDNNLTRKELLALVDYIQRKWVAAEALQKTFTQTDEVIDAHVEATVDQAIELYEKAYMERPQTPEEFVANTAEIIFHEPDGSLAQELLGGTMEIKNKFFY
jgi:hypothetical protein